MRSYDMTTADRHPQTRPNLGAYLWLVDDVLTSPVIHTGEWHSMDTSGSKAHGTHELEDVTLFFDPLPIDMDGLFPFVDQSWADNHFLERVSGVPMNPAPSHVDWPYTVRGNEDHTAAGKFDHTYPERFWPKYAGLGNAPYPPVFDGNHHKGIRFPYGDLSDVVDLLVRSPLTRQAYLPVWFPEDTGAVRGQRVPCTLGYHFMVRNNRLSCRYYLRSCDLYRHLSNDVYFAGMLTRWIMQEVNQRTAEMIQGVDNLNWTPIRLGALVMHITSLHSFVADDTKIRARLDTIA